MLISQRARSPRRAVPGGADAEATRTMTDTAAPAWTGRTGGGERTRPRWTRFCARGRFFARTQTFPGGGPDLRAVNGLS